MKRIITITAFLVGLVSLTALAHGAGLINATIASFKIFINGEEKQFEKPIIQIDGSTYLPLRETAETLGMDVNWVAEGKKVELKTSPGNYSGDELFVFRGENGKYGYMDRRGNIVIHPRFDRAENFSDGLAAVCENANYFEMYGCINTKGELVLPFQYTFPINFNDGFAWAGTLTDQGEYNFHAPAFYIDKSGNKAFEDGYEYGGFFEDGIASVSHGQFGEFAYYIDKTGKVLSETFYRATSFSNGYALVQDYETRLWGVIDRRFKLVIDYKYDFMYNHDFKCQEGLIAVLKNKKYGMIDLTDKVVIGFQYDYLGNMSEGLVAAKKNDKWGFIDAKNTVVIPFNYDYVRGDFSEGYAIVNIGDKYGVIDKKGKYLIEPKENMEFKSFNRGLMYVNDSNLKEEYYIDHDGNKIIPH